MKQEYSVLNNDPIMNMLLEESRQFSSEEVKSRFDSYRQNIIGINSNIETVYGSKPLVYADWIASGRLYKPIENKMVNEFGIYVANTHSESSFTGKFMTKAYHEAQSIIKKHVNANEDDVILTTGTGMTSALAKLQRILGLRLPDKFQEKIKLHPDDKPVVFLTHMEHHSNQTPWLDSIADVVIVPPTNDLTISLTNLESVVKKYAERKVKIGSFTACSNVSGIRTPYHEMAGIMHKYGGICLVDFAASAPYDEIDMHPDIPGHSLDAIFFSPHKFLGGPGSSGVLIFNRKLYSNKVPDNPGGGTVKWTNPWGQHSYFEDIEVREDGGTPGFLQTIRAALCVKLKEEMGVEAIAFREHDLLDKAFNSLTKIPGLHILADNVRDRLGVVSFYVVTIHYNLIVAILSDKYGVQVRGGCSCAGTYGHLLLNVTQETSKSITDKINLGDLSEKPGWVRLSIHPTMTDNELEYILYSIKEVVVNIDGYRKNYIFDSHKGEYFHKSGSNPNTLSYFSL